MDRARLKRLLLTSLVVPALIILGGCQSDIKMTVSADDTYTMTALVSAPKGPETELTCKLLADSIVAVKAEKQMRVTDSSDDTTVKCTVEFTQPQPISATKHPFIQITHKGEVFTAKLAPSQDGLIQPGVQTNFSLSITFPGPILDSSAANGGKVKGQTITWSDAKVLQDGFTVTARDYTGLSQWELFGVVILIALGLWGLFTLGLFIARRTQWGAPLWEKEKELLIPVALAIVGAVLWLLDLGYRWWRRLRLWLRAKQAERVKRSQGTAPITRSIPVIRPEGAPGAGTQPAAPAVPRTRSHNRPQSDPARSESPVVGHAPAAGHAPARSDAPVGGGFQVDPRGRGRLTSDPVHSQVLSRDLDPLQRYRHTTTPVPSQVLSQDLDPLGRLSDQAEQSAQ